MGEDEKMGMRNKCKNRKVGLCSLSMAPPLVAVSGNPSPSLYTANTPSTAIRLVLQVVLQVVMNLVQDPDMLLREGKPY